MSSSESTTALDESITSHLNRLLESRAYPKTICPSEVARALSQQDLSAASLTSWRDAMGRIREMALQRDDVEMLQHNVVIPREAEIRGPIRLRLRDQLQQD